MNKYIFRVFALKNIFQVFALKDVGRAALWISAWQQSSALAAKIPEMFFGTNNWNIFFGANS